MTWIASRPPDEMKLMSESGPAARALCVTPFRSLQQKGRRSRRAEAQALAVRENEIALKHGLRKFAAAMFEWNGPLAEKWMQVSERLTWVRSLPGRR